ncbi:endonuclease [Marinomonas sp. UCMA 3892]|uniref:endonuclease n=1 Tax=Marinomonas sp. UCMA 3892 TaxID=1972585 RepID=UPI002006DF8E|nr:endonuclease [Marinomonas sp. UCMA 3892]
MNRTDFFVTFFIALFAIPAIAEHPTSFSQAKRFAREIYQDNQSTFYCGCSYNNDGAIDAASCGYEPRKQPKRGERLEWEHVVSAWEIGHQRQCWQNGGRRNCEKNDAEFSKMVSDLHNLVPSVGSLPVKAFSRHYLAAL